MHSPMIFVLEMLSKIVVKMLEIMFTVVAFSKIDPACQTDENGIKPGSNLNNDDKCVAEPFRAFDVPVTHTRMFQEYPLIQECFKSIQLPW